MNVSDKGKRLGNFIIDLIAIIFIGTILSILISFFYPQISNPNSISFKLFIYFIFFLYYFIFEISTGKTIGKILTKTIVVDNEGNRPNVKRLLIRNLIRLIPFDCFSFLFGQGYGLHDLISKTTVRSSNETNTGSKKLFNICLIIIIVILITSTTCILLYLNFPNASFQKDAQEKLTNKNYTEALKLYNKIIELDTSDATSIYNRGICKYYLNDHDGACMDWQRAKTMGIKEANSNIESFCK